MQVRDAMTTRVVGVQSDATIAQAVDLMLRSRISGIPVYDSGKALIGILSEGDLLRRAELGTEKRRPRWIEFLRGPGRLADDYVHAHSRKVEDVMTPQVVTTTETASLIEAVDLMQQHNIKRLPVTFNGRVVGIITRADVLRALAKLLPAADKKISDEDLRTAVVARLNEQNWARVASVSVNVSDGVVEFRGSIMDERQRPAILVLAENVPGVKAIHDHLIWVEPNSGAFLLSPEDDKAEKTAA
ncbi:MAG: CBS domain-containing protein [Methylobacteriaceae bacterium]|nr:CBS domain-containing protein [Methylobacteriaceae bacterium]